MSNIKQRGVNYEWGTFSMNISGRVGYQCSNYYRALITKGEIEDDNYYFENGKLKFRFRNQQKEPKKVKPRKRKNYDYDKSGFEEEEEEEENSDSIENLLPDMIDPVTCTAMVQPAISPYGHVMEYIYYYY